VEHISDIDHFLKESKRVLKNKGVIITVCPDWSTDFVNFYDDPTHIRPFTIRGLSVAHELAGFEIKKSIEFLQLPFTWDSIHIENLIRLFFYFVPKRFKWSDKNFKQQRKLIRHAKEGMLLVVALKND
jgi:ubiquinone/menaquinone biosynthesis C-methylase UbiE